MGRKAVLYVSVKLREYRKPGTARFPVKEYVVDQD
jgi:hypothetical protein